VDHSKRFIGLLNASVLEGKTSSTKQVILTHNALNNRRGPQAL